MAQTRTRSHPGRHDRVRGRRDTRQSQRPGRAEVGDRRVGRRVGADRDPAAQPAVGAAHQATTPLVRAAGDRKLGGKLRVHGQQQTLAGERDRQHPDPGRACHGGADEHDRVEPDDGRDRREAHRGVVEEAKPARELLPVPQLREACRVGIERRRDYETHGPLRAVELASRVFDRARDFDTGGDAQLLEDVDACATRRSCRSGRARLRSRGSSCGRLRARRSRTHAESETRARCRLHRPARVARRGLRVVGARGVSRRGRAASRTRRARARPRRNTATASSRSPAAASARPCRLRESADVQLRADRCGGLGRTRRHTCRLSRLATREQYRRARAAGQRLG